MIKKLADDPHFRKFLEDSKETLDQIDHAAFTVSIADTITPEACLQIGAAVLYDKPIILLVPQGMKVSTNLKRMAVAIVHANGPNDTFARKEMEDAVKHLLANDVRAKKKPS